MRPQPKASHNKKIFFTLIFTFLLFSLLLPRISLAADSYVEYPKGWEIVPQECLNPTGDCNLDSFVKLFVNLANIMLKIVPTLAMLTMITGGAAFLISGGSSTRIETGKKIITSTVIGVLIIIGLGWTISFFVVSALTGDSEQVKGTIFSSSQPWSEKWWSPRDTSDTSGGGGTTTAQGCCVVTDFGCKDQATKLDCDKLMATHNDPANPYINNGGKTFWTENQACDKTTNCQNYKKAFKCCVPPLGETTCYKIETNLVSLVTGCLNWPNTKPHYDDPNSETGKECSQIAQCLTVN